MKMILYLTAASLFIFSNCIPTIPQDSQSPKISKEELQVTGSVESSKSLVKKVTVLKSKGGRVEWSPDGKTIYFDMQDKEGYFDIYQMSPDGSNEKCLTCETNGALPKGHNGQPSIHPNGKYLVFQAQKKEHVGFAGRDKAAQPGLGRYHDLWMLNLVDGKFHRLTELSDAHNTGILHPRFSHSGNELLWTQMYDSKKNFWKMNLADFSFDNQGKAKLTNTKSFEPGGEGFYETHDFSPDGKKFTFTGNFELTDNPFSFFTNKIYNFDLKTEKMTVLATERYNESAHYAPVGSKIVWFNSVGNKNRGTDYWSMNYDGSKKKRLTDFNNPVNSSFQKKVITCADFSFSPDGKKLIAYLQTNILTQNGMIVMMDLADNWYQ